MTGAVGGALITTSHERAERFRARMIVASTDYLTAAGELASAATSSLVNAIAASGTLPAAGA